MSYSVYILSCADDTLYTGITTDVERRIKEHNGLLAGGAKYTMARRPVRLVYTETYPDRSTASKEEYRLKNLSRAQKQYLIQSSK
mgnify:CR=1 FL=1